MSKEILAFQALWEVIGVKANGALTSIPYMNNFFIYTNRGECVLRVISLILVVFSAGAYAQDMTGRSAYRAPGTSYLGYKSSSRLFGSDGLQVPDRITPMDAARAGDRSTLPKATEWENEAVMTDHFNQFRDYRFMTVPSRPNFLRRSSWMYPDDGCFARAALAVRNLVQWSIRAPKKVFAFGDLRVKSVNALDGEVTWWYHVAPLVETAGRKYVLDPAIEPSGPIPLEDWLARMSDNPSSIEVSVCESGAYTPSDDCRKSTDGIESGALRDQVWYLEREWHRLEELKRKPHEELGEYPPWLH